MKTVLDGKQWILESLLNGGAKSVVNGGIYKDRRPSGSVKEDIVINDIVMDNRFFQDGAFNVNCYVPFISVTNSGTTQYQPNHTRLKEIAERIYPLLHDVWGNGYNFTVVNHKTFEEEAEKANYINFRLNLKAFKNN